MAAENYYQHAEHYFRLIATAQEQFRQQNPYYNNPTPQQGAPQGAADDNFDDDDEGQPFVGQNEPSYAPQPPQAQPQPFLPRDAQPFPPRDQPQNSRPPQPSFQQPPGGNDVPEVTGLPAFITGGGQPQQNVNQGGPNGQEQGDRGQERYGRRRRRHRGGGYRPDRPDFGNANPQGAAPVAPAEGGDEPPRQPE